MLTYSIQIQDKSVYFVDFILGSSYICCKFCFFITLTYFNFVYIKKGRLKKSFRVK